MRMHMRYMILVLLPSFVIGCVHRHAVLSVDVKAGGGCIKTRYRYCIATRFKKNPFSTSQYAKWQPDVFDNAGIPIVIEDDIKTYSDCGGNWSVPLMGMTCCIFPGLETEHEHETWSFGVLNDKQLKMSLATCKQRSEAMANNPLPFLLFRWNETTCFENGMTYDAHSSFNDLTPEIEMEYRAKAFAIASWLKEMEDSGKINDTVAANAMSALQISMISAAKASVEISDSKWKGKVIDINNEIEQPFEIEKCECEDGRDFAYGFTLKRKGGGNVTFSEYAAIRSAFRRSITDQYHMNHPDVDTRSLIADFTECTLSDSKIKGRIAILTLEVKTLFYNSSSRTGRMSVKIGLDQFEDARRCIRKRIEELASRSNIVIEGDKIPPGARFYTGNETLKESGLLEVEFKTE